MRRVFGWCAAGVLAAGVAGATPPPIVPRAPMATQGGHEPAAFAGMVAAHNRARRAVGVPDLAWSDRLAGIAQGWAERLRGQGCPMRHSGAEGIGENLAWASGQRLSVAQVVGLWVGEARSFNPATGTCAAGAVCGHYTQVVWRGTRFVGCGMARCGEAELWVCNYSPPGNYVGERPF